MKFHLLTILFLTCCLVASADITPRERMIHRLDERWAEVVASSKKLGLETDLTSYEKSIRSQKKRLLNDQPWLTEVIKNKVPNKYVYQKLYSEKDFSFYATGDHQSNMALIQEEFFPDLKNQLTDKELYARLLEVITPCNDELDAFKKAIQASDNLGSLYVEGNFDFYPAEVIGSLNQLLLFRGTTLLADGQDGASDIRASMKLAKLSSTDPTFVASTVSIAIDLYQSGTASFLVDLPSTHSDLIIELINQRKNYITQDRLTAQYKLEYAVSLEFFQDAIDGKPIDYEGVNPKLKKLSKLELETSRIEIAKLLQKLYFIKTDSGIIARDITNQVQVDDIIDRTHFSSTTQLIISEWIDGLDLYTQSYVRAMTLLDLRNIETAAILYEKESGKFPERLELLAPKFLKKIPVIPFTGKPYTYTLPTPEYEWINISGSIPVSGEEDFHFSLDTEDWYIVEEIE